MTFREDTRRSDDANTASALRVTMRQHFNEEGRFRLSLIFADAKRRANAGDDISRYWCARYFKMITRLVYRAGFLRCQRVSYFTIDGRAGQ